MLRESLLTKRHSENIIASKLKVPYLPERKGWSWADLGLHGVHDYVVRMATPLQSLQKSYLVHLPKSPQSEVGMLTSLSSADISPNVVSSYHGDTSNLHYQSFSASPQYPPIPSAPLLPSQLIARSRNLSHGEKSSSQKTEREWSPKNAIEDRDTTTYDRVLQSQDCRGICGEKAYYTNPPTDNAISDIWMYQYSTSPLRVPANSDGSNFMHLWPGGEHESRY